MLYYTNQYDIPRNTKGKNGCASCRGKKSRGLPMISICNKCCKKTMQKTNLTVQHIVKNNDLERILEKSVCSLELEGRS